VARDADAVKAVISRAFEEGGKPGAEVTVKPVEEWQGVSRLRAYGTMTYSGFKSLIFAHLPRSDPRVAAANDWVRHNYTVTENPGLGRDGVYYYYLTFARALDAWGDPKIQIVRADGSTESRDWALDLIDQLAKLQNPDGSFKSLDDRWMENNPVLITAYALIALEHAAK
jgi:squalene-hopene/tetraprenyl-beta-curcumene cyclase